MLRSMLVEPGIRGSGLGANRTRLVRVYDLAGRPFLGLVFRPKDRRTRTVDPGG